MLSIDVSCYRANLVALESLYGEDTAVVPYKGL